MKVIKSFRGKNRFLSNFYEAPVEFKGIVYQNAEAAFQAQKCKTDEEKKKFSNMKPQKAKKQGSTIKGLDIKKWNKGRIQLMKDVCKAKFEQNKELAEMLLSTEDSLLIEGNNWGDTFWGADNKTLEGENNLGKILMEIREEIK